MELIKTQKLPTLDRDFEVYTYRDNNNDRLIIEASEIVNGRNIKLENLKRYVPMNGNWHFEPHEYPNYHVALGEVAQAIVIYTHSENSDIDFPIP